MHIERPHSRGAAEGARVLLGEIPIVRSHFQFGEAQAPRECSCSALSLFSSTQVQSAHSIPVGRYLNTGHTAWRIEDGVFAGAPNVMAQTTDGYLWIGTQAGLTRFDGVRFVSWRPPEGKELPSSRINSLLGARDGSLWIGTAMGLARVVRDGKLTCNYRDEVGAIMAILEDHAGTIWIARANIPDAKGPLCKVIDTELRCYGKDDGVGVPYAVALANDSLGNVWLAGGPRVSRWQTNSRRTPMSHPGWTQPRIFNGVLALASGPDGSLWVRAGALRKRAVGCSNSCMGPGNHLSLRISMAVRSRSPRCW